MSSDTSASSELPGEEGSELTTELVKRGLHSLGSHPISLQLVYLHINVSSLHLRSIDILANYSNLILVDISDNLLVSLRCLSGLPYLTTLIANRNRIQQCLDFGPPHCTAENPWSQGHFAIGSMLTFADLSCNQISTIGDIRHHEFMECLLLQNNRIEIIPDLQALRYLLVLDLSNNRLTSLDPLKGLRLHELYASGNKISSLQGISELSSLRILHADSNLIESTASLAKIEYLREVSLSRNRIQKICDLGHLRNLDHLVSLSFEGNPCSSKPFYRYLILPALTLFYFILYSVSD